MERAKTFTKEEESMIGLTKTCTACGIEQGVNKYYKKKMGKNGVGSECRSCVKQRATQYYAANKEQSKAYRAANKEVIAEQMKTYYKANKEAIVEKMKAYQKANKEALVEWRKAYHKDNKEAIAQQRKVYQKANLHIYNAISAKRKASKLQATPAWVDFKAIKGMYQLAAIFRRTGIDMHVDHIVPLRSKLVSGLHSEANLQLMPAIDNMSKGNRYWPDMPA
jgi:hypothetical protein